MFRMKTSYEEQKGPTAIKPSWQGFRIPTIDRTSARLNGTKNNFRECTLKGNVSDIALSQAMVINVKVMLTVVIKYKVNHHVMG